MSDKCNCTRFFLDCEEAARIYDEAVKAYLDGREQWGSILASYYLWHKRRFREPVTVESA